MRAYIHAHRSEFLEEGQAEDIASPSSSKEESSSLKSFVAEHKNGERYSHRRSATGDTISSPIDNVITRASEESYFNLAYNTIRPIFLGALAMFDGSRPAGPIFIVVVLLASNIWTLTSRPPSTPSRHLSSTATTTNGRGGREARSPNEVAQAVREALQEWFKDHQGSPSLATTSTTTNESHQPRSHGSSSSSSEGFEDGATEEGRKRKEAREIGLIVEELEARLLRLKESLNELD